MNARDIMTPDVITVGPDTLSREIAQLLLQNGISGVPVVDDGGLPIGMISESDLILRNGPSTEDREDRRDWWLAHLAEGESLNPEFLASFGHAFHRASEIMSSPVVTVDEETEIHKIARVLAEYRVKRVPVVREGRIVGIVSRVDLLRAFASQGAETPAPSHGGLSGAIATFDHRLGLLRHPVENGEQSSGVSVEGDDVVTASTFRDLVADAEIKELEHHRQEQRLSAEQRRRRVEALIDEHISDDNWRALMHQARIAAEHGQREFLLIRFPSQLCSDGGRAVNAFEADWPATLRGEAAEIYLRWHHYLRGRGFRLAARVLDFPGGVPGDIGLYLVWGGG